MFSLWFGRILIARFARDGLREDVGKTDSKELAELHKAKQGTPTMGGVFLIGGMLISAVLWLRFDGHRTFSWLGLLLVSWFAAVGLIDDWIKLKVPGRNGLSARAKQLSLSLGALVVGALLHHYAGLEERSGGPQFYVPFVKESAVDLALWGGVPFLLVSVVVLTGAANAVNLTDGLDGLAVGCVAIAGVAYAGICYLVGSTTWSDYLLVVHVAGSGELTVMLGAMLGASLAFLWYNAPPAQVFMGDVGISGTGRCLGFRRAGQQD